MGEYHQTLLEDNTSYEAEEFDETKVANPKPSTTEVIDSCLVHWKWWIELSIYTTLTISGLVASILLGRIYYDQGGNSKWLIASIQTAGFPILIPFLLSPSPNKNQENHTNYNNSNQTSNFLVLASISAVLGLLLAATDVFYSLAIDCLPASTYSLLNSSQLAFTALFSFLLNAQKFTPYIINSIVLLTFSPMLLIFGQENDEKSEANVSKKDEYMLGVLYTMGASICPALMYSLTQLASEKTIRSTETVLKDALAITVLQSVVATIVTLVGLMASGEWRGLMDDMEGYEEGVLSYNLNLGLMAIACQAYFFGSIALTFKVSSLFCNVVIRLGTPVTPLLSVLFLHEEMSGLKVMSLMLALWGFASYIYQQYIDGEEANAKGDNHDVEK